MAIWQDLVDTRGFTGGYQSVKRFVRKLAGSPSKEACAVIETAAGEEAQVDYGTGPMVRDPHSGKYRRMRLFVLTLGYSRKAVRLLLFHSSTQTWAELHEKAFRRLGGCTREVVLDNLREGVLKPDIYDPTINPVYADMLKHYGVIAMPCRVRDPDRKGKVESGVGHAQKTPLKGMRFESPQEAQAYLDHWEAHWADTRIHGTTKRQVAAMFAEERPALLPLPVEPFRYYRPSGRLRGGRSGLLRRASRLDRPPGQCAVGHPACAPAEPQHRPATARAPASGARRPSHPRARPPQAYTDGHGAPAVPRRWKWALASTASCAAIWSAIRNCR
jgi:transposase